MLTNDGISASILQSFYIHQQLLMHYVKILMFAQENFPKHRSLYVNIKYNPNTNFVLLNDHNASVA